MWKKLLVAFASLSLVAGCGDSGGDSDQNQKQEEENSDDNNDGPSLVEPNDQTASLLEDIENYRDWNHYAGNDSKMESGHPGDKWVITHGNETANQAHENDTIPFPAGAIMVKEEYNSADADSPAAVTIMEKTSDENGDWYWVKASPDLQKVVETPGGAVLQGNTEKGLGCVDCHAQAEDNDYSVLH